MLLTQQNLQNDRQLLGRVTRRDVVLERGVKNLNLLGKEPARDKVLLRCTAHTDHLGQLAYTHVKHKVPGLPQSVLMRGRQRRMRDGRAVKRLHDPLGQEEITKQTGHEQILPEELLKEIAVEHVPRYGVRDGREDPVEFAHHGLAVVHLAGNPLEEIEREAGHELAELLVRDVPVNGGLDRCGQTGREDVGGQVRMSRQHFAEAARAQMNRVAYA